MIPELKKILKKNNTPYWEGNSFKYGRKYIRWIEYSVKEGSNRQIRSGKQISYHEGVGLYYDSYILKGEDMKKSYIMKEALTDIFEGLDS